MLASISGKITLKRGKFLIIESGDIGFKVFCSAKDLKEIPENGKIKLFTHLYLKEERVELYGFLAPEELNLFEILNGISGIGPKSALSLASVGSLEKLKKAIETGDQKLLGEIKGIGTKKLQKILLELSGKIKEISHVKEKTSETLDEAEDALVSLGFSRQRVRGVLNKVPKEIKNTEDKVKSALKLLTKI